MTENEIKYYVEYYNLEVAKILNVPPMKIDLAFSRAFRAAGTCIRKSSILANIKISKNLASIRSDEETKNTIIHELCHAYDDKNSHHGYNWKCIAEKVGNKLGYNIKRTYELNDEQQEKIKSRIRYIKLPIGKLEVPEINYKKYVYKRGRLYNKEYKGCYLRLKGKKYPILFTKL